MKNNLSWILLILILTLISNINALITSPNESLFSQRNIFFNISFEENIDKLTYIDLKGSQKNERKMCNNCKNFEKFLYFKDGNHYIIIKAIKNNRVIEEKQLEFSIDTKKPIIKKTNLIHGDFVIEFIEENPSSLELYFGNNKNGLKHTFLENFNSPLCLYKSSHYTCSTNGLLLNELNKLNGEEIEYRFELKDRAGNMMISKIQTIKIELDLIDPIINHFDYYINKNRVDLEFNITEENFDKITYIDLNRKSPREKILCSQLKEGYCKSRINLKSGEHQLIIFVKDENKNYAQKSVKVFIK